MAGFYIKERMVGEHKFFGKHNPDGVYPFEFNVKWGTLSFREWLNPSKITFLTADLEGTVSVGGLCKEAKCVGTLSIDYIFDKKIVYSFNFVHCGKKYIYVGEKVNIRPWNFLTSHTTCFGTIVDENEKLVSRSISYFKLFSIFSFLSSFKIV